MCLYSFRYLRVQELYSVYDIPYHKSTLNVCRRSMKFNRDLMYIMDYVTFVRHLRTIWYKKRKNFNI